MEFLNSIVSYIVCYTCSSRTVGLVENANVYGMSSLLEVVCCDCETTVMSQHTSPCVVIGRTYDINDVYSCKSNGVGYAQACSFISDLNLPQPTTSRAYYTKLDKLATACTKALEEHFRIIRIIVKEEHLKLEEHRTDVDVDTVDIAVSYDGTWQKRGNSSHNGVFVVIDVLAGYVIDFEVMSNYCQVCEKGPKDDSDYNEFWKKR